MQPSVDLVRASLFHYDLFLSSVSRVFRFTSLSELVLRRRGTFFQGDRTMKKLIMVAAFAALTCLMPGPVPLNKVFADDEGLAQFFFAVTSGDGNTSDRIGLLGAGTFGIGFVKGSGTFQRSTPTVTPPNTLVNWGTWKATRFLSFTETPGSPFGQVIAGILTMEVELRPLGQPRVAATMQVVCNSPGGGLFTGKDEGITLTLSDGTTFAPIGQGQTIINPGRFQEATAADEGEVQYFFAVNSGDGNTADRINLNGAGKFDIGSVEGGGTFQRSTPTVTPPNTLVNWGTWKATTFLSFTQIPGSPFGQNFAGILRMQVELRPLGQPPVAATMEVVCNVAGAALFTGEDEGVTLTLSDGTTFGPIGQGATTFPAGHGEDN
jgi:hypothetical protein